MSFLPAFFSFLPFWAPPFTPSGKVALEPGTRSPSSSLWSGWPMPIIMEKGFMLLMPKVK